MNRVPSILVAFVLLFFAFIPSLPAATSGVTPGPKATVEKITGSATYTDASGKSNPLKEGMTLAAGSTIITGPSSKVQLDLGQNGNALTIEPDTTLAIDKLDIQDTGADVVVETRLDVKNGSILGNVRKLSKASVYEVKTEKGVAAIRGTSFRIFAIGIFKCMNGQLIVTISTLGAQPRAFAISAGNQFNGASATLTPIPPAELRQLMGNARPVANFVVGAHREPPGFQPHPNHPPRIKEVREQIVQEALQFGLTAAQANLVANAAIEAGISSRLYLGGPGHFITIQFIEGILTPIHGHFGGHGGGND